jgi:hypothetical protein
MVREIALLAKGCRMPCSNPGSVGNCSVVWEGKLEFQNHFKFNEKRNKNNFAKSVRKELRRDVIVRTPLSFCPCGGKKSVVWERQLFRITSFFF